MPNKPGHIKADEYYNEAEQHTPLKKGVREKRKALKKAVAEGKKGYFDADQAKETLRRIHAGRY